MPTAAKIGFGAAFGIKSGSTYTAVAEVVSIEGPSFAREAVDATHLGSADGYREYIAGLMDGGEVSIEMNYIPSASDTIVAALQANTMGSFQITFSSGIRFQFDAVVTAYSVTTPLADKMTASATFKVSGKPVFLAASP